MTIQFEGAGERRKELVKAMAEVLGQEAKYQGAPGFAYRVGEYLITKNGDVETDDFIDPKTLGQLLIGLRANGFNQIGSDFAKPEEAPAANELEASSSEAGIDGVVLRFPKDDIDATALENLKKLVEGKAWLIKKALEADELPIEEDAETLRFPWLKGAPPSELVKATTFLIAALIKLAKKQKRVTLTANETDNPRYAFRCFLLRLGFIGKEYKDVRKTLMDGIPGNGSIRHIETPEEVAATYPVEEAPEPCEIRKIGDYNPALDEREVSADEQTSPTDTRNVGE